MNKESRSRTVARIRLAENVTIPPQSEMVLYGKAEKLCSRIDTPFGLIEPAGQTANLQQRGVNIGATVAPVFGNQTPISVVNISQDAQFIRKGTTVAVLKPAACVQTLDEVQAIKESSTGLLPEDGKKPGTRQPLIKRP